MGKEKIEINDFGVFFDTLKAFSKLNESVKLEFSETGLGIYGKNSYSRIEILSDALTATGKCAICIKDLQMFLKILNTIKEVHQDDYTGLDFTFDGQFINFKSKKFKTKLITCDEEKITNFVSKPIHTVLNPVLEFTTNSQIIKTINNHSFIFSDPDAARVYLKTDSEMENNVIYANIGNKENNLNNSLTLKFGLINFGELKTREITLDFKRLNAFNIVQSNEIKISLMDRNVLVYDFKIVGKQGNFSAVKVLNSIKKD